MQLTCPHCQFSKDVPDQKLPTEPTRVSCPQCKGSFTLPQRKSGLEPEPEVPQIKCPACGIEQAKSSTCASCGLIFAKYRPPAQPAAPAVSDNLADRPKAGFWLRFVAVFIDAIIVVAIQFVLGFFLALAGAKVGRGGTEAMGGLLMIFGYVISFAYYIILTGHGGQTLGKMILRIQVVRTDGTSIGYGKAFFREVIGKFISGIIFAIGYLMAAFDDQKQALHDRMARTYVIKL